MNEPSSVRTFLDAYRAAFETMDAKVIADFFHYPFQITSDAGAVSVTAVPSREAWLPQLERLVGAYLLLGVHTADVLSLQVDDLSPQLGQASVHWGLVTAVRAPVYDFTASYTLADLGEGTRITAIAHNESPRLRAALGARQPG